MCNHAFSYQLRRLVDTVKIRMSSRNVKTKKDLDTLHDKVFLFLNSQWNKYDATTRKTSVNGTCRTLSKSDTVAGHYLVYCLLRIYHISRDDPLIKLRFS
jgi:hypothetical protein